MIRQKEELTEEDQFEAEQMVKTALENRLTILDTWKSFEDEHGQSDSDAFHTLKLHLPKRIKKRRKVTMTQDGESGGWEEYWDYIFPEEEEQKSSFKLLQMARAWKETKQVEDSYSAFTNRVRRKYFFIFGDVQNDFENLHFGSKINQKKSKN